jgi:2-dehydro-3-deoxygluconokinase
MRLAPGADSNWISNNSLPVYIGGAELNVASALALWDQPVRYITAIPENYLSREIISSLEKRNIDCSQVKFCGDRIGIYYLPLGSDLKNAGVIYDREGSSFSRLKPGELDWKSILSDVDWFHFSAITPALNAQSAQVCLEAVEAAASGGIRISVDLNYRSKLWQYGEKPSDIMNSLVQHAEIVMGNPWAAESLLDINAVSEKHLPESNEELIAAGTESIKLLAEKFPAAKTIAFTFRMQDRYFGILRTEGSLYVSSPIPYANVIDRVGSGDCFMAALIYGIYNRMPGQQVIDLAAAAAVGKLSIAGDATNQRIEDILLNQTLPADK